MEESSEDAHWSKRLQRPRATQPGFHRVNLSWMLLEESGRRGTAADNALEKTKGWSHRRSGRALVRLHGQLVFHYTLVYAAAFPFGWLIDMKRPRLNVLQNQLDGEKKTRKKYRVLVFLSSLWSNSLQISINFKTLCTPQCEDPSRWERVQPFFFIWLFKDLSPV